MEFQLLSALLKYKQLLLNSMAFHLSWLLHFDLIQPDKFFGFQNRPFQQNFSGIPIIKIVHYRLRTFGKSNLCSDY